MSTPQTTVREIALEQPAAIRVFEKFGIDYCCGGRKPLAQACEERSLNTEAVMAAIADAEENHQPSPRDWATEPLEAICTHIVQAHHAYIRAELPRLRQLAQKVVSRHGESHPELQQIQSLVESAGEELLQHLAKEEMVLFPYITSLERNLADCGPRALGCFGSVRNPIGVMMAEHDAAGEAMTEIRELSCNFTPPAGACPTWRGFYAALADFERDLHQHVHLENNILFPRAIELEESCG